MDLTCEVCAALEAEAARTDVEIDEAGRALPRPVALSGIASRSSPCPRTFEWHCPRRIATSLVAGFGAPEGAGVGEPGAPRI